MMVCWLSKFSVRYSPHVILRKFLQWIILPEGRIFPQHRPTCLSIVMHEQMRWSKPLHFIMLLTVPSSVRICFPSFSCSRHLAAEMRGFIGHYQNEGRLRPGLCICGRMYLSKDASMRHTDWSSDRRYSFHSS